MKKLALALGLFAFLLSIGLAGATTYTCNSCESCNTAIAGATAGDTVLMNASIYESGTFGTFPSCIEFNNTQGITFNCNGYEIVGSEMDIIHLFNGSSQNTINNCNLGDYAGTYNGYLIWVENSFGNTFQNIFENSSVSVTSGRFWLDNASQTTIKDSIFYSFIASYNGFNDSLITNVTINYKCSYYCGGSFVFISSSSNVSILNLTVFVSDGSGLGLDTVSNSVLENIYIKNVDPISVNGGVELLYADNNTFINATVKDTSRGFYIVLSTNNTIKNSNIQDSSIAGIFLHPLNTAYNLFYNNILNNSVNLCQSTDYETCEFGDSDDLNYWNTTLTSGTNIIGGSQIGGNYWTGFSENCNNNNNDSFCDDSYTPIGNNTDYLPLTSNYIETFECGSCSSCSDALGNASSGDIVQMNASVLSPISPADGGCIINPISSFNITFDCNGFSINISDYPVTAIINHANNFTIRNCNIILQGDGVGIGACGGGTIISAGRCSGIIVENITINGPSSSMWSTAINIGILNLSVFRNINVNSHSSIVICDVNFSSFENISIDGGMWGIILTTSISSDSIGNIFRDITIQNLAGSLSEAGFPSSGFLIYNGNVESTIDNNTFTNITFESNEGGFLWLCGAQNCSEYNVINDSRFINNSYGIYADDIFGFDAYPQNNLIYNNFFNNTVNVMLLNTSGGTPKENFWNTTLTAGTNIVGGSYIGGNYWAYPNGTGYSETCLNQDNDPFCDSPYALDGSNTDFLPLALPMQDSDNDGLLDSEELAGWDITVYNCDGSVNYTYHVTSDPYNADEDGDGLNDYEEKAGWTVRYKLPKGQRIEYHVSSNPHYADWDNDGLNDSEESRHPVWKTDPNRDDTDCDSAWETTDGFEIDYGLNPTDADTDNDTITDGQEIDYWLGLGLTLQEAVSYSADPDVDNDSMMDADDSCPLVSGCLTYGGCSYGFKEWLPPIANQEEFQLQDGATLPLKFNATGCSGGFFGDELVKVGIYNETLGIDKEYNASGTGDDYIRIDASEGLYITNIHTGQLGMPLGVYTIVVRFGNGLTSEIDFELVQKGVGKGKKA